MVAMAGMNPMQFLREKDPHRSSVLQAIAEAASEIRKLERESLAVLIINRLAEAMKG